MLILMLICKNGVFLIFSVDTIFLGAYFDDFTLIFPKDPETPIFSTRPIFLDAYFEDLSPIFPEIPENPHF